MTMQEIIDQALFNDTNAQIFQGYVTNTLSNATGVAVPKPPENQVPVAQTPTAVQAKKTWWDENSHNVFAVGGIALVAYLAWKAAK